MLRPLTPIDNPAKEIKPWRAHPEAETEMLVRRAKRNVRLHADKLLKEQNKKDAAARRASRRVSTSKETSGKKGDTEKGKARKKSSA